MQKGNNIYNIISNRMQLHAFVYNYTFIYIYMLYIN